MTTEIEKQFFEAFGIEPIGCKDNKNCTGTLDCRTQCPNAKYPQITDRILLELICLVNIYLDEGFWAQNITDLKEEVLNNCLLAVNTTDYGVAGYEESFKHQVQALFKEG